MGVRECANKFLEQIKKYVKTGTALLMNYFALNAFVEFIILEMESLYCILF